MGKTRAALFLRSDHHLVRVVLEGLTMAVCSGVNLCVICKTENSPSLLPNSVVYPGEKLRLSVQAKPKELQLKQKD